MVSQMCTYAKMGQIVHFEYVQFMDINYTSLELLIKKHFCHMCVYTLCVSRDHFHQCELSVVLLTMAPHPELELKLLSSSQQISLFFLSLSCGSRRCPGTGRGRRVGAWQAMEPSTRYLVI